MLAERFMLVPAKSHTVSKNLIISIDKILKEVTDRRTIPKGLFHLPLFCEDKIFFGLVRDSNHVLPSP